MRGHAGFIALDAGASYLRGSHSQVSSSEVDSFHTPIRLASLLFLTGELPTTNYSPAKGVDHYGGHEVDGSQHP